MLQGGCLRRETRNPREWKSEDGVSPGKSPYASPITLLGYIRPSHHHKKTAKCLRRRGQGRICQFDVHLTLSHRRAGVRHDPLLDQRTLFQTLAWCPPCLQLRNKCSCGLDLGEGFALGEEPLELWALQGCALVSILLFKISLLLIS